MKTGEMICVVQFGSQPCQWPWRHAVKLNFACNLPMGLGMAILVIQWQRSRTIICNLYAYKLAWLMKRASEPFSVASQMVSCQSNRSFANQDPIDGRGYPNASNLFNLVCVNDSIMGRYSGQSTSIYLKSHTQHSVQTIDQPTNEQWG